MVAVILDLSVDLQTCGGEKSQLSPRARMEVFNSRTCLYPSANMAFALYLLVLHPLSYATQLTQRPRSRHSPPNSEFQVIPRLRFECMLFVRKAKTLRRCRRRVSMLAQVLTAAGYANRAFWPSRAIPSNPAVRSVKVPDSGAEVTEEEERSLDTANAFPPPFCVPLAFQ